MSPAHTAGRAAGLALAVALSMLASGCTNDDGGTASPTGDQGPTATATPTWKLRPVVGERTTAVIHLGSGPVLGLGQTAAPDQQAVDAAVDAVGDWLDSHLDGLQRDGAGTWGHIAASGLAETKRQRRLVTTALASPDAPVEDARYLMSVYHDGAPQYLTTRVEVTHPDGSVANVGLVFVIDPDGTPRLTMFGPEPDGTAAQ